MSDGSIPRLLEDLNIHSIDFTTWSQGTSFNRSNEAGIVSNCELESGQDDNHDLNKISIDVFQDFNDIVATADENCVNIKTPCVRRKLLFGGNSSIEILRSRGSPQAIPSKRKIVPGEPSPPGTPSAKEKKFSFGVDVAEDSAPGGACGGTQTVDDGIVCGIKPLLNTRAFRTRTPSASITTRSKSRTNLRGRRRLSTGDSLKQRLISDMLPREEDKSKDGEDDGCAEDLAYKNQSPGSGMDK